VAQRGAVDDDGACGRATAVARTLQPVDQHHVTPSKLGIGVVSRAPSAGKTRLAPHLSPERLQALCAALLSDTLDVVARARCVGDEAVVFFTPPGSESEIARLVPHAFDRARQADGDLGQRMRAALEELLDARGCDVAVLVGSDIPFLTVAAIIEARDALRSGGVVFGPTDDGGYYLIGMSTVHARLFENIEWSTAGVLAETLRAAERIGVAAHVVRGAYDIDTIEDLRRAERDLATAAAAVAPNLRRWFDLM
jgi:uncharacterized protein